ncbi:type I-E CRISPR-associated protein Cse2/CasB [Desulfolutivibrio sulfoxidireducens]|uniref:type I-E CRISPR-associated protein Cse2/CasB n=1 Tax=Desulfolutivibrio sulfoxidireducens TaxID=2773299 RepID=UPI00159D5EAC|nr:type I-E CRISPR-associated protein Cse2/CasB [Desulfolutivibrio sulfoxidireducens]QLA20888.1 type I-E CRISPR-associated protein Cse2/CasB [Desulfolutivibrio sulfoxidireducens]
MASPRRLYFDKNSDETGILASFWKKLEARRGPRAALRRAATFQEAVVEPVFWELTAELKDAGFDLPEMDIPKLALLVILAARVKSNSETHVSLARAMALPRSGDSPPVSRQRFKRLLAERDLERSLSLFTGVLRLLGSNVWLPGLAWAVWRWDEPGDAVRFKMAADYFGNLKDPAKTKKS